MSTNRLALWLNGTCVAHIDEHRRRLRLAYSSEALEQHPLGTPLLSLALPLRPERYTHGVVRPFVEGLLPEGEPRRALAEMLNLAASDTFGLIAALGRDCAGALVIQPEDDRAPAAASTMLTEALSDSDLVDLVANLSSAPLGVNDRVRLSLGGVQEKLLLTKRSDGTWARPLDGTPSTHILKPEIPRFPGSVTNEAFCMRIARHLDIAAADVETTEIGGRPLLVVQRWDRLVRSNGTVERIHQEDLCQATSTLPTNKYQDDGGPSLARIAALIESSAEHGGLDLLLKAVTLNAIIANGDAHAKNFALVHNPLGTTSPAPLYDLMCTLAYGDDHVAMYVDNVRRTTRLSSARIVNEALRWGLPQERADEIVDDMLTRAPGAIKAAADETTGISPQLITTVEDQLARIRISYAQNDREANGEGRLSSVYRRFTT